MSFSKRLNRIFNSAEQIPFDDASRIVLMSDCHRGDGSWADNFAKNKNIFYAALTHYYYEGYTYIEIGDGDELWENKKVSNIVNAHNDVIQLLSKFFKHDRLFFIYGNHDMVKKNSKFIKNEFLYYFDEQEKKQKPMINDIKIHEALVLCQKDTSNKIFLVHGHQVDFLNYTLWKLSRFLVRYLWRPLELIGVNDPTSTAKNYEKKALVEKKLAAWAAKENQMMITGHTHRPVFAEVGEMPYFNDGCGVHPDSVTAIEIARGNISLVKWCLKARRDGVLYVSREVLSGPRKIKNYFNI